MIENIELSKIRIDGETQRRDKIDQGTVDKYAELMADGEEFPAVALFYDGVSYWLADGFHRYHAHNKNNAETILAEVVNGTLRDAIFFSLGANKKHGKETTRDERKNNVLYMLRDIEWSESSDRQIASVCGVTHVTVWRLRKDMGIERAKPNTAPVKKDDALKSNTPKDIEPEDNPPEEFQYGEQDDRIQELVDGIQEYAEENMKLKDQLSVQNSDVSETERKQLSVTLSELRDKVKAQEAEIGALRNSRDQFQAKNAELVKQVAYWRKRAEKLEK
jgi:hypothetical protein